MTSPPITDYDGCVVNTMAGYCVIHTMGEEGNCPCRGCAVKCMCSKVCDDYVSYSHDMYLKNNP